MVLFRVDKVVAVTLLEAVKTTMEQIGAQRMEQADRGVDDSRQLVTLYGDLRRLKDYLQRSVGAFRDRVEFEAGDRDLPLLCAACCRGAEVADQRLTACTDLRERALVVGKRDTLIEQAIEFATEPLLQLPLPNVMPSLSPGIRGLRMRIARKFAERAAAPPAHDVYNEPLQPIRGDLFGPVSPEPQIDVRPHPIASPHQPPPLPAHASSPIQTAMSPRLRDEIQSAPLSIVDAQSEGDSVRLLDPNSIRDPRLRAIMALDLRAFERAVTANDIRLAAVHLTSVLEGAVLDHAMLRTTELGLTGTPDTWNAQEVLLRIFGERCQPQDRAAAYHVFAARRLIQPGQQLKAPIVVTALALRKHVEFVGQALRLMGFTG